MIEECYECRYANEYLAWWWFRICDPTCLKGLPMNVKTECKDFKQIGRRSRMTLYENLEEFCLNYVNYWNVNEELEGYWCI